MSSRHASHSDSHFMYSTSSSFSDPPSMDAMMSFISCSPSIPPVTSRIIFLSVSTLTLPDVSGSSVSNASRMSSSKERDPKLLHMSTMNSLNSISPESSSSTPAIICAISSSVASCPMDRNTLRNSPASIDPLPSASNSSNTSFRRAICSLFSALFPLAVIFALSSANSSFAFAFCSHETNCGKARSISSGSLSTPMERTDWITSSSVSSTPRCFDRLRSSDRPMAPLLSVSYRSNIFLK
mmetsp:Transcript_12154/g.37829  ORF Transcript_12154/g.37829 Transcript_12154/m.37829 type:complete len:240 (-) Transcript_12154:165-884(-)